MLTYADIFRTLKLLSSLSIPPLRCVGVGCVCVGIHHLYIYIYGRMLTYAIYMLTYADVCCVGAGGGYIHTDVC